VFCVLIAPLQVEVALKMAFRKFMTDHGLLTQLDGSPSNTRLEVRLLPLRCLDWVNAGCVWLLLGLMCWLVSICLSGCKHTTCLAI
jgi:hypothetical protein